MKMNHPKKNLYNYWFLSVSFWVEIWPDFMTFFWHSLFRKSDRKYSTKLRITEAVLFIVIWVSLHVKVFPSSLEACDPKSLLTLKWNLWSVCVKDIPGIRRRFLLAWMFAQFVQRRQWFVSYLSCCEGSYTTVWLALHQFVFRKISISFRFFWSTDKLFLVFMLRQDNGNVWNVPKQNTPQSKIAKNCTLPWPKPTRLKKGKLNPVPKMVWHFCLASLWHKRSFVHSKSLTNVPLWLMGQIAGCFV